MKALRKLTGQHHHKAHFGAPDVEELPEQLPQIAEQLGYGLTRIETQDDQDEVDEEKRRAAMRDLVESWMDRLQLISVITTFFASTEASLLSISPPSGAQSTTADLANAGLCGALVVHSSAAIISFLGAFFLVKYKLRIAKKEEEATEQQIKHKAMSKPTAQAPQAPSPISVIPLQPGLNTSTGPPDSGIAPSPSFALGDLPTDPIPGPVRIRPKSKKDPSRKAIWSNNPHLVQVGPFQTSTPTHWLARCHSLSIFLTTLGFVLALMGIMCWVWDSMKRSVSIVTSFFMLVCLASFGAILVVPDPAKGEMSRKIYYVGEGNALL